MNTSQKNTIKIMRLAERPKYSLYGDSLLFLKIAPIFSGLYVGMNGTYLKNATLFNTFIIAGGYE